MSQTEHKIMLGTVHSEVKMLRQQVQTVVKQGEAILAGHQSILTSLKATSLPLAQGTTLLAPTTSAADDLAAAKETIASQAQRIEDLEGQLKTSPKPSAALTADGDVTEDAASILSLGRDKKR